MVAINDSNDLEVIVPEHYKGGFYYFPDDRRIAVSMDGELLNIKTNKLLKQHTTKKKIYFNVVLTSPGVKHKAYKVHRIIARTFIGRPSRHINTKYCDLVVNHIDHNGLNNDISNLEWVNDQENSIHSYSNVNNLAQRGVFVKDNKSGIVTTIRSMRSTADLFGISVKTLFKHLNSSVAGAHDYSGYSFMWADSTKVWPAVVKRLKAPIAVYGYNTEDMVLHRFDSIRNACQVTGLNYNLIYNSVKKKQSLNGNGWVIYIE